MNDSEAVTIKPYRTKLSKVGIQNYDRSYLQQQEGSSDQRISRAILYVFGGLPQQPVSDFIAPPLSSHCSEI